MDKTLLGGCQCGVVRFETRGDPLIVAICHCSMCRRANAAPAVAWAMYKDEQVRFVGAKPRRYASSARARRGFCAECGTQICFTADYIPGLIDVTVGSFDQPQSVEPALHYWDSMRLPWARFADNLPRHAEFPPLE